MARAPREIGGYEIVCPLGEGGMATVYLAVSKRAAGFSKLIVVKILRDNGSDDPETRRMFLDEARIAAILSHPNVVQTYEAGEDDGKLFLAMEYLEGKALNTILAGNGIKDIDRDVHLRIIADGLLGLHYAHEVTDVDGKALNVIHRDISPHNLFVTYDGQAKLVDFGIAKVAGSQKTESGIIKGKISYIAPELVAGNPADRRVDIFGAGVMIFEALSRRRMVERTEQETAVLARRLAGADPSIRKHAEPGTSEELIEICAKAMASNPQDRYATALELHDALDGVLARTRTGTRPIARMMQDRYADDRASAKRSIEDRLKRGTPDLGAIDEVAAGTATMGAPPSEPTSTPSMQPSTGTAHVSEVLPAPVTPPGRRVVPMVVIGLLGAAAAFGLVAWMSKTPPLPPPPAPAVVPVTTARLSIEVQPRSAVLTIDGSMQSTPFSRSYPRGSTVRVEAKADGCLPATREVRLDGDMTLDLALPPAPAVAPTPSTAPIPVVRPIAPAASSAPATKPTGRVLDEADPYRK